MFVDVLENLRVSWNGLAANKARSGLTMLGVVIGVATVIALLSIGQGAQDSITGQITSAGTNLLLVSPGQAFGRGGVQSAAGSANSLTADDAAALGEPAGVPDAEVVAPEYGQGTQVIVGDTDINTQVKGTTAAYVEAYDLALDGGRFISDSDVRTRANVAVLGAEAATDLFGDFDPLGQKIKVAIPGPTGGLVGLTVVGVLAEQGSSGVFGNPDDTVFVPMTTAQYEIFDGRDPYGEPVVSAITVVAAEGRSGAAGEQVDAVLRARHELEAEDDADFSVTSQEDLLDMAADVTGTLTVFLGAIAVISLVVGGIGIMNIMLVSVTERTREIGIRKAVGARRSDILWQFLLEAIVLSILGGIAGIGVGAGVAELVDALDLMATSVSPTAVLLATGFSLAVGLLSGVYPANRAASQSPIEALRYE